MRFKWLGKGILITISCFLLLGGSSEEFLAWDIPFGIKEEVFFEYAKDILIRKPDDYLMVDPTNFNYRTHFVPNRKNTMFMGQMVKQFSVGEVKSPSSEDWLYDELNVFFDGVQNDSGNTIDDIFFTFSEQCNYFCRELERIYGEPTELYFTQFSWDPDIETRFLPIPDFSAEITPEACKELMPEDGILTVRAVIRNINFLGTLDSTLESTYRIKFKDE